MSTVGNTLRLEIEQYAQSLRRSGALIVAARQGKLTGHHVSAYVGGLLYLIRGTIGVLERAEVSASGRGDLALAAHYRSKLREERGHDRWAEKDLERLPPSSDYGRNRSPMALQRLVIYLDKVTDQDPCLFLSYILLAEYLTVLAGPEWLEVLERSCGVPQAALTVVANHVELDRDHVVEGVRTIDALVTSHDKVEPMLNVLRQSISYYEEFWSEILCATPEAA